MMTPTDQYCPQDTWWYDMMKILVVWKKRLSPCDALGMCQELYLDDKITRAQFFELIDMPRL